MRFAEDPNAGMDGVVIHGRGENLAPVLVAPHGLVIAPGAARVANVVVEDDGARPVFLPEDGRDVRVYIDAANVVHVNDFDCSDSFPASCVPICLVVDGSLIDCRIIGA